MRRTVTNLLRRAGDAMETVETMAYNYRESEMETRTRRERGFNDCESKLPDLRTSPVSDDRPSLAENKLSYGTRNPLGKPITGNDTVWLLDNTAYRSATTKKWEAEFVAVVFDKDTGLEVSKVVADIAEKLGFGKGCEEEATIQERLMPFMQSTLPGRVVQVDFSQEKHLKLGPGGGNGLSSDVKVIPKHKNGEIVLSSAKVPRGTNGVLKMNTAYAELEGWGLISDIDDTIKITLTSDPIGILWSTFVSTPTPVKGMPELYAYIQTIITKSAPFFYLSASPYNLYAFLLGFRQQYYPSGTIILRDASWTNLSGLLSNLTLGTHAYKVARMNKINSWLPKRKMICIGDSTQSDPEAYAEIYRKHAGWVRLILIRKVTDIAAIGIEDKNKPERFENAFQNVPKDIWRVFKTPEECYQIIKDVVAKDS